jgi:hypothetical protein
MFCRKVDETLLVMAESEATRKKEADVAVLAGISKFSIEGATGESVSTRVHIS